MYIIYILLLFITTSTAAQSIIDPSAEIIVSDDFYDNRNYWNTDNHEKTVTIGNGKYRYEAKVDKVQYLTLPVNIDTSRDFVVEGRLAYKNGRAGYGLVFGRENDKNTWRFIVTDRDGQFFIRNIDNGDKKVIQAWKFSSYINQNRKMNTYSVEKKGSQLKFYANGKLLKQTPYKNFRGNKFGFFCSGLSIIEAEYFKIAYTDGRRSDPYTNQNNYKKNDYNNNYKTKNSSAPVIELREPHLERGFKSIRIEKLRIAGFAKTNAGLFEVKINGIPAYLGPDGYFSAEIPVRYGDNVITITATDTQYKSSTKTFTVKRQ